MRGLLGTGDAPSDRKVVHRSPECRKVFSKAEELCSLYQNQEVGALHLFLGILELEDNLTLKILSDKGVDIKVLKDSLTNRVKEEGSLKQEDRTTPFLNKYGRDITLLAKEKRLTPLIGRKDELLKVVRTLTRKTKNNPLLIGEAGVGKTAIVEGLAQRIVSTSITPALQNKRIIEITMSNLVAGTKYRGEFEERLKNLIDETRKDKDIIVFIDEIHTMIGAGGTGSMDAANILKPALARGEICCIGATTTSEYRKYIEKDPALERRFQPIIVKEPSPEATLEILENLKERYETHHNIYISEAAIRTAVELSVRYLPDRHLPDKALDLLDEACSRVKVKSLSFYGTADEGLKKGEVDEETVAEVLTEWTGLPVTRLTEEEKDRFIKMAEVLKKRVIGQDEAVDSVAGVIKLAKAGLRDPMKPLGVFLFLGPTGVGKTEMAKALSEFLFSSSDEMIRLDMSEYKERHSISRLIGAPPGYIGYDEEGHLSGKLRQKPYSVVLLDEIEKAHPEVFDLFLSLFDEGRLTDAKGRTIDAKNAIFIMTSNIGNEVYQHHPLGFREPHSEEGKTFRRSIEEELKRTFRQEFLNRIDEVVFFGRLGMKEVKKIAYQKLELLERRLKKKGITIDLKEGVIELLCQEGFDPQYGVRPLVRAIEHLITVPLSEEILKGYFKQGDTVLIEKVEDKIVFSKRKETGSKEEWLNSMQKIDLKSFKELLKQAEIDEELIKEHRPYFAIMFTDLKDSTLYYDVKGTILGRAWVEKHNDLIFPIIKSHKGWVIKTIGDAIMAAFRDPKEAVLAAVCMQQTLCKHNKEIEDELEHLHIRIGIHSGRVLFEGGDVSGNVVNVAARIESMTEPDQILISKDVYEAIQEEPTLKVKALGERQLKGKKVGLEVYEVVY